jgi:N-sulfoglucosamine sulfohydrolase
MDAKTDRFLQTAPSPAVALLVAAGALLSFIGCDDSASSPPTPPNIVLITADDLGWRDLGCFGDEQVQTPNLDTLCEAGVRFTNAFVTASSCSPSRASLLTGQYPHTNGVDGLVHRHPEKSLPPGYPTLASLLAGAGYQTAIQGKWHLSARDDPEALGYQENLSDAYEQLVSNDLDVEKSLAFIERNQGNRFYLEINSKHNHRLPNGEFEFDPDFPVDPDSVQPPEYWHLPDWPEIRLELAKYYSQTQRLDWIVGQVINKLNDLGLAETTIIVFLGDNGPPFPGAKMTQYDRGVGTPLIIQGSSIVRSTDPIDGLTSTIDLMPTLLEAAGVPIPDGVQGQSFLSLLTDRESNGAREAVYSEMTYHVDYLPSRAVRANNWKYIKNYSDSPVGLDECADKEWAQRLAESPNQPWLLPRVEEELYDLGEDPHEQVNLVGDPDSAQVLGQMRELLRKHMEATDDPFLDAPFTHDYVPPE